VTTTPPTVGTAFEAGFMLAHGKRLFGYTSAEADYVVRVSEVFGPLVRQEAFTHESRTMTRR
jgi:nucleoside 2-deoxyribosyltransferase